MQYPSAALTYIAATVNVLSHLVYPIGLLLFGDWVRRSLHAGRVEGAALLVATALVALWAGIAADFGTITETLTLLTLATCLLRPTCRAVPVMAFGAGILLGAGALFKDDLLYVALAELTILAAVVRLLPGRPVRIATLTAIGFVSTYLALWIATGQRLSSLPRFWIGSWQLSSGYSAAMSVSGRWWELAAIAGLAGAGIMLGPIQSVLRRRAFTVQQAVLAMSLPWLFVVWKEGLVRFYGLDTGRSLLLLEAILAIAWLMALLSPRLGSRTAIRPSAAALLCAVVVCVVFGPLGYAPPVGFDSPRPTAAALQAAPAYVPPRLLAGLHGHTVNALPWDISLVVDNHLSWDPLPEPQTYSAYTSYLDRLDAAQLASPRGASRVVVSLEDIDGRYLFWDPPRVWDTVLSRYSCEATSGNSAILDRRAPRVGAARALGRKTASLGEWVPVPGTVLPYEFADVHITSSLQGTVLGIVLRQGSLSAMIRLSNGTVVGPLRLVASTAGDGLYLSHYVTSTRQLCGVLAGDSGQMPRIAAVRFTSADPSQWATTITITFRGASIRRPIR
jgi:hypothetical protein